MIRVINCDDRLRKMGGNVEKRKHDAMLPSTTRAIVCGPSNCGKTNSHKLVGKSARCTFQEHIRTFEIVVTAEISIFGEFVVIDR